MMLLQHHQIYKLFWVIFELPEIIKRDQLYLRNLTFSYFKRKNSKRKILCLRYLTKPEIPKKIEGILTLKSNLINEIAKSCFLQLL